MPFDAREFAFGWNHILQGAIGRMTRQPRNRFVTEWQAKGVPMTVLEYEGKAQLCQHCGYVLGEVALADEWLMHACSAIGFNKVLGNEEHKQWLEKLTARQAASVATGDSAVKNGKDSLPIVSL